MREKKTFVAEARYLLSVMRTVWDDYDFSETSNVYEHRVPNIYFDTDVELMVNEVHYIPGRICKYIREYQIKYGENVYVFKLSSRIENEIVRCFEVDVSIPAGDGKGGLLKLFSENLV